MVHRAPALLLRVPLEHGEVDHPQRPPARGDQFQVLPDSESQRAQRIVDDLGAVRAEEHHVAVLRARALENPGDRRITEELDDRGLEAIAPLGSLVDLEVGKTLGAIARHESRVVIYLRARHRAAVGHSQRGHASLRILRGTGKHLEIAVLHQIRDILQLERNAQVRSINAEAAQRLGIGHPRQRIGKLRAQHGLKEMPEQLLHQTHDVFL